jgi:hypothetical protein
MPETLSKTLHKKSELLSKTPDKLQQNPRSIAAPEGSTGSPLPAKVVSLRVRPFGVSHLCFETGGILGDLNLALNPNALGLLGATVPFFDFDVFYAALGSAPTQPATGFIEFSSNPAVGTEIWLLGTNWIFGGGGRQSLPIGATLAATLAAAVSVLEKSTDLNTAKFTYSADSTTLFLTAATGGTDGNSLTFSTTVSGATASGSTLSGADPSRLVYEFLQIQALTAPFALASLRAEPQKTALNKAINARQNAYFSKYGNLDGPNGIIATMNASYGGGANAKPYLLQTLSDIAEELTTLLGGAYNTDGRTGVVKNTTSALTSDATSYGYSAASASAFEMAVSATDIGPGTKFINPRPPDPPAP